MPRGDNSWGSNNPTGKTYERLVTFPVRAEPKEGEEDKMQKYIDQLKGYSELETTDLQYATFETADSPEGYNADTPVTRIHMPQPTHNSQHHVQWRLWKLRSGGAVLDLRLDKLVDAPEPEPEPEPEPTEADDEDEETTPPDDE